MGSISNVLAASTIRHRFDSFPWMRYVLIVGTLVILIIWINYLGRVGRKRKKVEIYYNINEEITKLYEKFLSSFKQLISSKKIWDVASQIIEAVYVRFTEIGLDSSLYFRYGTENLIVTSSPVLIVPINAVGGEIS